MLTDRVRAAIMLFVGNIVTLLVLFAIVEWTGEQVAIVNATINSGLIVVALLVPSAAQTPQPTPPQP